MSDYRHEDEMVWEWESREAIEEAMTGSEFDEIRGVIVLSNGEELTDYGSFYYKLIEIGEGEWVSYVPFDGGEAVFSPSVDGYV